MPKMELPWPDHKKIELSLATRPSVILSRGGVPLREMEEVRLTIDQMEALRLADLEGLSQKDAGAQMGVSRATFGRIIQRARYVVADALINGKAILLDGGNYQLRDVNRTFACPSCSFRWEQSWGSCPPLVCPTCGEPNLTRAPVSE